MATKQPSELTYSQDAPSLQLFSEQVTLDRNPETS